MTITPSTTIHALIETHPYMLDWLVAYDAHFENLRNPLLYKTMAKVATLETAASMAGVPVERFVDDVRSEVARRGIIAEEAGEGSGAQLDPEESARRAEALKGIIRRLHDGASVESVKADFDALATGIDSVEIARMEQSLIAEGMPVEEVQRLCDVHVSVFKSSLDVQPAASVGENHPLDAYRRENEAAAGFVARLRASLEELGAGAATGDGRGAALASLADGLEDLAQIDVHFTRKENQLFPVLEAHDVVGPTKVMWAIDDDIRGRIRSARALVAAGDAASLAVTLPETLTMVEDMIYKEEKILFPTALGVLSRAEWERMAEGDAAIGYAWVEGPAGEAARSSAATTGTGDALLLPLPTGSLTLAQLDLLFRALPFDVTYVDEDDRVRFYSEGDRVFPRSPGAIGREVRNCHPPKSLAKVEAILAEFRAGSRDIAEFWIHMGPKFVHIRYFALRDVAGEYRGCLEVVQDATHVRSLEGDRRIVDW